MLNPSAAQTVRQSETSPWRLDWLTPFRSRLILAALILLGSVSHIHYLRNDCPIDLSGDEAQYWEWSRVLDWSYYSKGPAVAYIIRASTELFGNTMWAVRLPALVLASLTTLLTYWLTLRLFKSDRLALGAVLLNHLVPMFVAGSILMTIDPPYFFCWALATAFFALAVLEEKRWAWLGVGFAVGLGILAKYGMLIWPIGMFIFLAIDRPARKWLKSPWPYLAIFISLVFLAPPIIWNIQHDWVTFKHVATQTGATKQKKFFDGNFLEFVGSQLAVIGPSLVPVVIGAVVFAVGRWEWLARIWNRAAIAAPAWVKRLFNPIASLANHGAGDPNGRAMLLLVWTGLPIFLICLLASIRSKMQVNWPAAAYFSWMILAAYFISTRMNSHASWKRWRGWVWSTIVFGIIMMPIAHDFGRLYWMMDVINHFKKSKPIDARNFDPTAKLKGWEQLGQRLSREIQSPGLKSPFILCEDYMQTAQTAFYTPGQPKTFCVGPYLSDPKRHTQYDVWPDRSLAQPSLVGRDAIYVGYMNDDVERAFDRVEELPEEPIVQRGYKVRRFKLYRCYGFHGMKLSATKAGY